MRHGGASSAPCAPPGLPRAQRFASGKGGRGAPHVGDGFASGVRPARSFPPFCLSRGDPLPAATHWTQCNLDSQCAALRAAPPSALRRPPRCAAHRAAPPTALRRPSRCVAEIALCIALRCSALQCAPPPARKGRSPRSCLGHQAALLVRRVGRARDARRFDRGRARCLGSVPASVWGDPPPPGSAGEGPVRAAHRTH